MLYIDHRQEPSLKNLLFVLLLTLPVVIYVVISIFVSDPVWFRARFDHIPESINVYCYGEKIELERGSRNFQDFNGLLNESLSGWKRWDQLSLSEKTYQEYRTHPKMVAVEAFYSRAVRIHNLSRFYSTVSHLIIPLEGRHADAQVAFGRHQGAPMGGSLQIENTELLREYLARRGICPHP